MINIKDIKQSQYLSYGIDSEEDGRYYWYLQTANDGIEDFEIISSRFKYIPFIIGNILSFIFNKRLEKW